MTTLTTDCQLIYEVKNSNITINLGVTVFEIENLYYDQFFGYLENNQYNLTKTENSEEPVTVWEYTDMLEDFDVSYIVCRDTDVFMKFAQDSRYRLVMNCGHVAVFEVTK